MLTNDNSARKCSNTNTTVTDGLLRGKSFSYHLLIRFWSQIIYLHIGTCLHQNRDIFERDNRLPSNINMLIELIRKVEETPGINLDMRQMALALTHRFRLDGIERAPGAINPGVTPFRYLTNEKSWATRFHNFHF